jgi:hypothetical protein
MNLEDYEKDKLWPVLIETVHANVMYPTHKAYTRDVVLHSKPEITPEELSSKLNLSFGEALVVLHELKAESKSQF